MARFFKAWLVLGALGASGCSWCGQGPDNEVVAYTSVDQVYAEPVLRHCETETGLQVRGVFDTEEAKSTGVLNRLIAEKANPRADVFWSGDPVRSFLMMRRALGSTLVPSPALVWSGGLRDVGGAGG